MIHTPEESKKINQSTFPCVIVSASGMATGGRVVHHLQQLAPNPRNLILLPGFQAAGTRGRALADGVRSLNMYGGYVPVRAEVVSLPEFSAHADAGDVLAWLRTAPRTPATCYIVHGEPHAAASLAERVDAELGWCAAVARPEERVVI